MNDLEKLFNEATAALHKLQKFHEQARKKMLALTEKILSESPLQPVDIARRTAILAIVNDAFSNSMESKEFIVGIANAKSAMEDAMGLTELAPPPTIQ